jgi:hypothetical protein
MGTFENIHLIVECVHDQMYVFERDVIIGRSSSRCVL